MGYTQDTLAHRIIDEGYYEKLPPTGFIKETIDWVHELVLDAVEQIESATARTFLEQNGLTQLHRVMGAEKVGALRDHVMTRARPRLFTTACRIARETLGITGEFYLDDYSILRVNYPFEVASHAPMNAENPGNGRLSGEARDDYQLRKVIDPVFNPKAYQKNLPPPAWAHGPHLDTWAGHSRLGINLWWAVDDTLAENSMVLYPEFWNKRPRPNPRTLYIDAGHPLGVPVPTPLQRGEMLIFNPEMLHGTHLNLTDRTRIALTLRINPDRPTFSRGCFYSREYWQSSSNIESGKFDHIVYFRQAENFMPEEDDIQQPLDAPVPYPALFMEQELCHGESVTIGTAMELDLLMRRPPGGKLLLVFRNMNVILLRLPDGGWRAVNAACPHLGVNLMDGAHDQDAIYCPGCGVRFGLQDGACTAASLKLPCYQVRTEGDKIVLICNDVPG